MHVQHQHIWLLVNWVKPVAYPLNLIKVYLEFGLQFYEFWK